jgi:hypothetical protein
MTMERQQRFMRTMASAFGGDTGEIESAIQHVYSDSDEKKTENREYIPLALADPRVGGEVTPAFGENEVQKLPINLGYSIIESEQ